MPLGESPQQSALRVHPDSAATAGIPPLRLLPMLPGLVEGTLRRRSCGKSRHPGRRSGPTGLGLSPVLPAASARPAGPCRRRLLGRRSGRPAPRASSGRRCRRPHGGEMPARLQQEGSAARSQGRPAGPGRPRNGPRAQRGPGSLECAGLGQGGGGSGPTRSVTPRLAR